MRSSNRLGGSACDDLEDDFDEETENFDDSAEGGDLDNPGELDAGDDISIPDDPNVDVDVDADVEAEIETDVDVDVDVTLEMFFDEEVERHEPGIDFVGGAGDESGEIS